MNTLNVVRYLGTTTLAAVFVLTLFSCANSPRSQTQASGYHVSGPFVHNNLTVFLIHGESQLKGKSFLTLQEAMEQKLAVVHETGNVNELAIENFSEQDLYVQSGDIVKGGQQDRTLAYDFIVPPKSGKTPIAAFCVESGRWSRRGGEDTGKFSGSVVNAAGNNIRFANRTENQGKVWEGVLVNMGSIAVNSGTIDLNGVSQPVVNSNTFVVHGGTVSSSGGSLQLVFSNTVTNSGSVANVATGGTATSDAAFTNTGTFVLVGSGGTISYQAMRAANGGIADPRSPTSYQLGLENKKVKDATDPYYDKLQSILKDKRDIIGFAYAINGKLYNADVFGSPELFGKLWPRLLRRASTEAIAEMKQGQAFGSARREEFRDFLAAAQAGTLTEKAIAPRVHLKTHETEKLMLLDSSDIEQPAAILHRNLIVK